MPIIIFQPIGGVKQRCVCFVFGWVTVWEEHVPAGDYIRGVGTQSQGKLLVKSDQKGEAQKPDMTIPDGDTKKF